MSVEQNHDVLAAALADSMCKANIHVSKDRNSPPQKKAEESRRRKSRTRRPERDAHASKMSKHNHRSEDNAPYKHSPATPHADTPDSSPHTPAHKNNQSTMAPLTQEPQEEAKPKLHKNSYLIFDWDDTLLCSHHMANLGYSLDSETNRMPRKLRQQLKRLERTVVTILETAIDTVGASNVVIITNADHLWVELSAQKYIPAALATLRKGVLIISARQRYENLYPIHPYQWKLNTFRDYLETVLGTAINLPDEKTGEKSDKKMKLSETAMGNHSKGCEKFASKLDYQQPQSQLPQLAQRDENSNPNVGDEDDFDVPPHVDHSDALQSDSMDSERARDFWLNVVSIGDSMAEREAVIQCCGAIDRCWTKCIKFHERPTIEQVITQLNYVLDQLPFLCTSTENIDWFLDPVAPEDE